MEQKLIQFLKKMWSETITPTLQSFATKNKENTDRIIKAFEEKEDIEEISINNPEDIVNPLIEAQNATTQAIKDLPRVEIPETDLKGLEDKIEALQKTLENKKLEVNIGETKLELKPVIEAIQKIKLEIPKMEKQEVIDYTMMLSQIMDIMERPQDHSHMIEMKGIMEKCARTEDIAILAEYLQNIIDKPNPEFPELSFTKDGRLKVEVDRIGGGGGGMGLTKIETDALINLESKVSTSDNQTNGTQKTQIVDSTGKALLLETQNGLPVILQDQYTEVIDIFMCQLLNTVTLASNATLDSRTITLVAGHGVVAGNTICLKEGSHFSQMDVLSVNVNVITFDTPLDFGYTTAAIAQRTTKNMAVNGSLTPQVFRITPVGLTVKFDITKIIFHIEDNAVMDTHKFGGITALTNGVIFRKKDGIYKNIFNIKSNGDFAHHNDTLEYDDKAPAGVYGLRSIRNIAGQNNDGVVIRLDPASNDELQIIIQDDLTGIDEFHCVARGSIVQD